MTHDRPARARDEHENDGDDVSDDASSGKPPGGNGVPYGGRPGSDGYSGHDLGGRFTDSLREQEFGQGQERYYGGMAQPAPVEPDAPGPRSSRGKRTALITAGAVAAVAILGGGGYLLWGNQGDHNTASPVVSSASPPTTASSSSASAPSPDASAAPRAETPLAPLTPGWRVQEGDPSKERAAFDVPPAARTFATGAGETKQIWQLGETSALRGYADNNGKPLAIGHSEVTYRDGFCGSAKGEDMGFLVFATSGDRDPADVSPSLASFWADAASLKKDSTHEKYAQSPAKQVTVNAGKTPAVQSRVTIPNTEVDKQKCQASKVELTVTSFTAGNGTASIVCVRDVGVPNAMSDVDLNAILASARPTA